METWWGQLSVGAAAVVLFVFVGRTFVSYVGKRVQEDRDQHREEVGRLIKDRDDRLAREREVSMSWETAARTAMSTAAEQADQLERLLPAVDTMVKTIEAIRQEQSRR